jgi:hypothetical protein
MLLSKPEIGKDFKPVKSLTFTTHVASVNSNVTSCLLLLFQAKDIQGISLSLARFTNTAATYRTDRHVLSFTEKLTFNDVTAELLVHIHAWNSKGDLFYYGHKFGCETKIKTQTLWVEMLLSPTTILHF